MLYWSSKKSLRTVWLKMETRTEITHLPMELVTHISRFFSPQSRNKLKEVSKLWHAHSSLVYHFYVLGSPIPVQRFDDTNQITLKKQVTQEEIDQSIENIPENGFMVFPTYRDAYLYAHNRFTSWIRNPNFHNGIMGTGIDKKISFTSERPYYDHILHHPVIFEVSFDNGFPLSLIKHPLMLRVIPPKNN